MTLPPPSPAHPAAPGDTGDTGGQTTLFGPPDAGHLRLERLPGGIARLVLCNEARRNAVSLAMWEGLAAAMAGIATEDAVRAVILTGAGDVAFCSGADLSEFGALRHEPGVTQRYNAAVRAAMTAVRTATVPVLAVIRGKCIGAGVALAAMADLAIADEACDFGIPAARLGVAYDPDWIARLVGRCGPATMAELLLFGARLGGAEALARGLVARILPAAGIEAEATRLARAAAEGDPLSHRASKAALAAAFPPPEAEALRRAHAAAAACDSGARYQQSIRQFQSRQSSDE